jgi:hypothetical protein
VSTIQETVDQSLAAAGYGSYGQYARPVVTALVDREQNIVGRLIEFANNSDLDTDAVRTALAEAGLHMPPAPQATMQATGGNDGDLAQVLAQINQTLQGLSSFARQHGYNG